MSKKRKERKKCRHTRESRLQGRRKWSVLIVCDSFLVLAIMRSDYAMWPSNYDKLNSHNQGYVVVHVPKFYCNVSELVGPSAKYSWEAQPRNSASAWSRVSEINGHLRIDGCTCEIYCTCIEISIQGYYFQDQVVDLCKLNDLLTRPTDCRNVVKFFFLTRLNSPITSEFCI